MNVNFSKACDPKKVTLTHLDSSKVFLRLSSRLTPLFAVAAGEETAARSFDSGLAENLLSKKMD
jgi:hypothetical protein